MRKLRFRGRARLMVFPRSASRFALTSAAVRAPPQYDALARAISRTDHGPRDEARSTAARRPKAPGCVALRRARCSVERFLFHRDLLSSRSPREPPAIRPANCVRSSHPDAGRRLKSLDGPARRKIRNPKSEISQRRQLLIPNSLGVIFRLGRATIFLGVAAFPPEDLPIHSS